MILLLSGHQELAPKQNRRTNQGGGYFAEENFCSVKFFPLRIDRENLFRDQGTLRLHRRLPPASLNAQAYWRLQNKQRRWFHCDFNFTWSFRLLLLFWPKFVVEMK
jgi:hypothetical protein